MTTTAIAPISELSDAELDTVAAAGYNFQVAKYNFALAYQSNKQVNAAVVNIYSNQGGDQTNINNSGNIG
jgi:hypothetical protein